MIDYEKAEALIGTEKYPEAIALLAAEPVSILDDGNFERMERCLSSLPEQVLQDAEGLQTLSTLAKNMAWLLKCIEAGKNAGIACPVPEKVIRTNFIR